ncbi:Methyl-accepting chemotaxis protein [Vibrio chagasii]|nr:Methyl-accepting chemotaxis protein [Vibrio chagasii]CAH6877232.1 Methyl-accepting chemotaxis protein [Vibrio chagasii]CAH6878580.1 Methyl-accepting chemotaxis protein [Vibrio chagasii]CAH7162219.1 Methyl-accepting chemotaxis protein [Vibrio chagasii]CAH7177097.1 Methyl-accepting chemotaxis protein [Vibrio chagasii]
MGGKSSSSNSTSTKNTSSQNAIDGDNLGVALSGIEGSTINATSTDHGSVAKSFDFAGDVLDESLGLASGALKEYSATNSENLQMIAGLAGNQAAQNTENLDKLTELAKFKQDNGQSALNKQQLILMAVIVIVFGFVLFKAMKK